MVSKGNLKHQKGLVELAPLLVTTPEMRILFKEYSKDNPQNFPINRWAYADKFYEWYNKLEKQSQIWIDNLHSGKDAYRDEHLHPRIRKKVQSICDGRRILDIGCGTGEAVIPYLKQSQVYVGLDTSRYALSLASEKYGIKISDYMQVSDEDKRVLGFGALPDAIPITDTKIFDEVLASMVLHHVGDYKSAIDSMMNLLHSGGNYFIVTFDSDKRKDIESFFNKIQQNDKKTIRGEFNLPSGKLEDITINLHNNDSILNYLKKYSDYVNCEENAGIFQIFEGIKKRGA